MPKHQSLSAPTATLNSKTTPVLSVFSLVMITIAGIVNLRNLPIMAGVGLELLFFYIIAAVVFLIPSALVCAELASSLTEEGGVYIWVTKAFGPKLGFFSIWSEWFNNVVGMPATLAFIAAALAFLVTPHLATNKFYLFTTIVLVGWGGTLFNFLGVKNSSRLNTFGALFGTIIPALIIIVLSIVWLTTHHHTQINFSLHNLFPPFKIKSLVFFVGVLSGYAGMQITAFHLHEVKNPGHAFPRALIISVFLILAITIFSSLAIAIVVPTNQLSLVSGVAQGFNLFLLQLHMHWALPIITLLIALSGISTMSAWLLAPARGLCTAAKQKLFPTWLAHENCNKIPTNILLLQAIIITALGLLFVFMPNFNAAFWLLMVMTSQFTLMMYVLVFASAIKLRLKSPEIARPFNFPFGTPGLVAIASLSAICCALAIILGFFPPEQLHIAKVQGYETILLIGNLCYVAIPIILWKRMHRTQKGNSNRLKINI